MNYLKMNNEYDSTSTPETGNFGLGRLTKVTDLSGSTAFQYDRLGNNIKKIRAVTGVAGTFATSSEYNVLSRETRPNITDSVGAMSQNFIYDELSRLKLAVSAATYGSKYYEYDRTGRLLGTDLGGVLGYYGIYMNSYTQQSSGEYL